MTGVSTRGCTSEQGCDPPAGGDDEGGGGGGNMAHSIQLGGSGAVSFRGPNVGIISGAENHPVGATKPPADPAMLPARSGTQRANVKPALRVTSVIANPTDHPTTG